MLIPIIDNLFLSKDKRQWIVKKRTNKKGEPKKTLKGEDTGLLHEEAVFSNEAFFYSLDQVARYALNRATILDDKDTLEDLIDAYDELLDSLSKYLKTNVKNE